MIRRLPLFLILPLLAASCQTPPATSPGPHLAATPRLYNIRDFGALGDGKTKDTAALQKALDTCAIASTGDAGEVLVPAGTYLIGSIQMGHNTTLRLAENAVLVGSPDAADYPSVDVRWEGRWQTGRRALVYAGNADHIAILGAGPSSKIEGNPAMAAPQNPRGSVVLEPINCQGVRWENFAVSQGGNWATHPTYCTDVVIRNLVIRGNRDGIDIDSSKNVLIDQCDIHTGDDSISLKSGRGLNGARIGKPVENVTITNCTLTCTRFATIGIGSEISGGVKNIRIERCTFSPRSFAVYIKSRIGRAGLTENLSVNDCDVLSGGFLKINLVSAGNTNTADDPVEGPLGIPAARNLSFTNIRLAPQPVKPVNAAPAPMPPATSPITIVADATGISPDKPLVGLTMTNITGTAKAGLKLANIQNASLSTLNLKIDSGPLLSTQNVTGTGLINATPLPSSPTTRP